MLNKLCKEKKLLIIFRLNKQKSIKMTTILKKKLQQKRSKTKIA